MSIKALQWVKTSVLEKLTRPSQVAVILTLADAVAEDKFYRSHHALCQQTKLSERGLRNILNELEALGIIMRSYKPHRVITLLMAPDAAPSADPAPITQNNTIISKKTIKKTTKNILKGSRIPQNWAPSIALREFAQARGFEGDRLNDLILAFKNYWDACPGAKGCKLNWDKTFQNWILRQHNYKPYGHSQPQPVKAPIKPEIGFHDILTQLGLDHIALEDSWLRARYDGAEAPAKTLLGYTHQGGSYEKD